MTEKTYTISEVAKMFKMQTSALRYYEEVGLLTQVERSSSGKRIYLPMHIHRLRTICCFKNAGMSIAQLCRFFGYEEDEDMHIDEIVALLQQQKLHLETEMVQLQKDHAHIMRKLNYYTDVKKALQNGAPRPKWSDYKK